MGRGFTGRGIFAAVALVAALGAGGCVSVSSIQGGLTTPERSAQVHERALSLVERKFFDPALLDEAWKSKAAQSRTTALAARDENALYEELNRLFGELKVSHLSAMTPLETLEFAERRRARLGLSWHKYAEGWAVEEVLPGSPAEEAGIRKGWRLLRINGEEPGALLRFRTTAGQRVALTCEDEKGVERTVEMAARILPTDTPPVERLLAEGFVYLRFDGFDRDARRWLSDALKRHAGAPGVVLDLRRNHGGQLFSLDIVVGELFPEVVPTGRFIQRDGDVDEVRGRQWLAARYAGPLVALVDDSTFSAAEILAHVLQHHRRATLVGRKTGGAVIGARFYRLPFGGSLSIPVIDYVGLDGRRLEGEGVTPDIPVERSLRALREGRDPDLEKALEVLRKRGAPSVGS